MRKAQLTSAEFKALSITRQNGELVATGVTSEVLAHKLKGLGFDTMAAIAILPDGPPYTIGQAEKNEWQPSQAAIQGTYDAETRLVKALERQEGQKDRLNVVKMKSIEHTLRCPDIDVLCVNAALGTRSITLRIPISLWRFVFCNPTPNETTLTLLKAKFFRQLEKNRYSHPYFTSESLTGIAISPHADVCRTGVLAALNALEIIRPGQSLELYTSPVVIDADTVTLCIQKTDELHGLLSAATFETLKVAAGVLSLIG